MKIGIYISELLFDHEEVTLNGFGTFYTRYNPARFVPEIQKVESPSKTIAFNHDKREGDSLLVAHIARKEKMEPGQVEKYLGDYVAEVREVLDAGKKFEMEKAGIFSVTTDGNLLFEPDASVNYLTDAVGMSPVKEPEKPASASSGDGKGVAPVTPTPLTEEKRPPAAAAARPDAKESPELPSALKWLAYTVVPLLVIIIILALNFNFFFGEGGLFSSSKKSPASTEQTATPVATPDEAAGTEAGAEAEPAAVPGDESVAPATESQVPAQATPATRPEAAPAQPEAGIPVYYIVVGSFPNREDAEDLAARLRGQGASQASAFMQTASGYHRVAYGFYYDLAEAERILPTVKENVNQEAYILHR
jgi:nucleoid DNA-binding protein/cell division protein FtsN